MWCAVKWCNVIICLVRLPGWNSPGTLNTELISQKKAEGSQEVVRDIPGVFLLCYACCDIFADDILVPRTFVKPTQTLRKQTQTLTSTKREEVKTRLVFDRCRPDQGHNPVVQSHLTPINADQPTNANKPINSDQQTTPTGQWTPTS